MRFSRVKEKYKVEILKKFRMTECRSMPTLMVMNSKKMNEDYSESGKIDPYLYRKLIGSLMYLVNTRPNICYALSHSVYELAETYTLDSSETCVEISTRHIWLWPEICL
jgi:hypothetical protein